MLKKKILKKLFITTLTAFILITIYSIPQKKEESLPTNLEIEYITGLGTNNIYLLTHSNHLVKGKILLDSSSVEGNALKALDALKEDKNSLLPNGLKGMIPSFTKIKGVSFNNGELLVNFSLELLNIDKSLSKRMIESIVYTLTDIDSIETVKILVEDKELDVYPNTNYHLKYPLSRNIGINRDFNINDRENVEKVIIYYIEEISNNKYYVPVTKYLNKSDDKIKIIIDELSSSYIHEPNLMSFLNSNTKLNSYSENNDEMILDFNKAIFNSDNKILEEVIYTISYSIFDNYSVDKIVFKVDNKIVDKIIRDDLR